MINERDKIKIAVKANRFITAQINSNAFINLTFWTIFI